MGDGPRPRAHWPYPPPRPARAPDAAARDPLTGLSPAAFAALEAEARARLWDETHPAWRKSLLNGKNLAYVRVRMRALLVRGA